MLNRAASTLCIATVLGSLTMASSLAAREYHDLFATPMGLSMGGAISSYVDDWNSLYYNPAGLAKMEKFSMRMPDLLHAEASIGIKKIIDKARSLDSSLSAAQQLKSFDGRTGSMRLSVLNLAVFYRRIGMALKLADAKTAIRLQTPTLVFTRAFYDTRITTGLSAGYGHSLKGDHVRVGFALRLLGRAGTSGYLEGQDIKDIGKTMSEKAGAGIGVDADIGLQGNLDAFTIYGLNITPMAGIVLQNIFATRYDLIRIKPEEFKGYAPRNQRRINAGVSAKIERLGPFSVIPSFEFRDLLIDTDSFWEYVSTGVQVGLHGGYWFNGYVRTAYHKGALAAGIGGNLGPGELELGTYAVGLSEAFGVGRDRRYYARLALNW